MRFGPCTDAAAYTTWDEGTILLLDDSPYGPVASDGQPWYVVALANNLDPDGGLPPLPQYPLLPDADTDVGWVPGGDGATALIRPLEPRCPEVITFETLLGMLPAEWLACFDDPFVLEGTFGCGGCGGAGGPLFSPAWLANPFESDFRPRWGDQFEFKTVGLHFKPSGPPKPVEGSVIRVTVHVDDPAAQRCTFTWALDEPAFEVPESTAINWCRQRLVVDAYEVIGMDEEFPA